MTLSQRRYNDSYVSYHRVNTCLEISRSATTVTDECMYLKHSSNIVLRPQDWWRVIDRNLALRMTDAGRIYLLSTAAALHGQRRNIIEAYWRPCFPAERRRRPLTVCPLQSDRCTASAHRAVPQVRSFIDDFRRRTDTSAPGAFDLAPAVAKAAPQMGYLSPNRPTASPLRRNDDVVASSAGLTSDAIGLHGLSRLIRAAVRYETIRYDTVRACRSGSQTTLMTARRPWRCVMSLPCGQLIDKVVVPLLTSSEDSTSGRCHHRHCL